MQENRKTMALPLPSDHEARLERARLSLDGLSIGDAFGERFFGVPEKLDWMLANCALPQAPWRYSDDTEMALAIHEVLMAQGTIDQDALAEAFWRRYQRDPGRGIHTSHHLSATVDLFRPSPPADPVIRRHKSLRRRAHVPWKLQPAAQCGKTERG